MRPSPTVLLAAVVLTVAGCSAAQGTPVPGTTTAPAAPATTASTVAPLASAPTSAPASALAPSASPTASAAPTPTSVVAPEAVGSPAPVESLILGDSISLSIAGDLSRYGYPVIGLVGQSATRSYLQEHLSGDLAQRARTWVIVLGTNNSGSPEDVAALPELIDLIDSLRTPGAKQQVRWVTPHRPPTYIGTKTAYNLDAFNAELSLQAMQNRWLRILDFDVLAKAHPEWFDEDRAMHLHPNAEGRAALVALITGPAPAPVTSPAPVIDAAGTTTEGVDQPEVFDNRTLPPTPPTPTAVEPPTTPSVEPAQPSAAPPAATVQPSPSAAAG